MSDFFVLVYFGFCLGFVASRLMSFYKARKKLKNKVYTKSVSGSTSTAFRSSQQVRRTEAGCPCEYCVASRKERIQKSLDELDDDYYSQDLSRNEYLNLVQSLSETLTKTE